MAYDPNDDDMRPRARPAMRETMMQEPPLPPKLAFAKTPVWDYAEEDTKEAFAELMEMLGDGAEEVELPAMFDQAVEIHRTIQDTEVAVNYAPEYEKGRDQLSPELREVIEHGQQSAAADYIRAVARIPLLRDSLEKYFDHYDAILTPAAPGEAPVGLDDHGQSDFLHGLDTARDAGSQPAAAAGNNGMPIGVQLVGQRGNDARLLRTARWLWEMVAAQA